MTAPIELGLGVFDPGVNSAQRAAKRIEQRMRVRLAARVELGGFGKIASAPRWGAVTLGRVWLR